MKTSLRYSWASSVLARAGTRRKGPSEGENARTLSSCSVSGRLVLRCVVGLLAVVLAVPALAQEDGGTSSAAEVAKALANPNATLGFLSFPIDYIQYEGDLEGASSQSAWKLNFQPSLPYPLGEGTNLFVRPLIPLVLDQPVPLVGDQPVLALPGAPVFESRGVELGDISFDVAIGKTLPSKLVLFGGLVGTLPTATDDALGLDQYLLGPEVFVGKVTGWGMIGVLFTHQWDIAGEDSFDTSVTGGQYMFTYNLRNAWQIQMSPTFSYNHEAESGQELTFPLGIGVSKTTVFGKTPWKFNVQYWQYVEKPDAFGPDFQLRLTVTPVIPLPW